MSDPGPDGTAVARKTAVGAGWVIGWRLFTRNAGLVSTLILVRLLAPEDFGLIAIATGLVATIDAFATVSVEDALIRDPTRSRALYDTGFTLQVLRALLTAAAVAAVAVPFATFFSEPRLVPIMFALAGVTMLSGFDNIGVADFRRDLEFHKEFHLQAWPRLAGVVGTVAAAVLLRTYWALVIGLLATRLVRLVQTYLMSPYRPNVSLVAWRGILGFSLWTWLSTVCVQVRERMDHLVIGRTLGTNAVGTFAIGNEIGSLTTTELVEPLHRALFSGFSSQGRAALGQAEMYVAATGIALMVVLPAGCGVSLVADPLVRLALGTQWLDVVPVIRIIGVGCTVTIFAYIGNALLLALGDPRAAFWVTACSTIVRVPLLIVCVMAWGLTGAAAALVVSFLVDQVVSLAIVPRRLAVSPGRLIAECWRPPLACLVMIGTMSALGLAWTPTAASDIGGYALDLSVRAACGAAVYAVAIGLCWMLAGRPDGAERHLLRGGVALWRHVTRRQAAP